MKRSSKRGNPYPHKYKYGKKEEEIDLATFKKIMEKGHFVKESHRSFLAFLYWIGCRKKEALERTKADFKITKNILYARVPVKKGGKRVQPLPIPRDLPYVDLVIKQVKRTRRTRRNPRSRIWNFGDVTAWRIVKRVMPEHYPHFFRLNRIVKFFDNPQATVTQVRTIFGIRSVRTINYYLGLSKRSVQAVPTYLRAEVEREKRG